MNLDDLRKFNREFLSSFLERRDGVIFNLDSKELIKKIPDNFIQTIYFDPPFSNKNVNDIPHKQDRESSDLSKHIWFVDNKKSFLKECDFFIKEFHRVLKDNGSIFFHLPWELAYDVKPLLDKHFTGEGCFKNEIIWAFRRWSDRSNVLQENHHTILWYSKSSEHYVFNSLEMPKAKSTVKRFGDEKIVSAVDKKSGKRIPSKTKGKSKTAPLNDIWIWDDNKQAWLFELDEIDEQSYIENNRSTWGISHTAPVKKVKKVNYEGDKTTYPFEKPKALIERLLKMSSNEGDYILDFFAGTGVVGEVCKDQGKKYVLSEISHYTTLDILKRLDYDILVPGLPLYNHFKTYGINLSKISGVEFEFWAGYSLNGISDDSFRGQDSYHGLDIFVKGVGDDFFPAEVKKKLTSSDEWYKIKSKTEKFFKLEKFNGLQKVFYIVSTEISKELEYEISQYNDIKFRFIKLSDKQYSYLLSNDNLEDVVKKFLVKQAQDKVAKELKKKSNQASKSKKAN